MSRIPELGRFWSFIFLLDPPGFLCRGRLAAAEAGTSAFRFRLAGTWVTVLLDRELAEQALSVAGARMFKPGALAPFLGAQSPLLTEAPGEWAFKLTAHGVSIALDRAQMNVGLRLAHDLAEGGDIQPTLESAAVLMISTMLWGFSGVVRRQMHDFLEAANSVALVCPPLRQLPPWRGRWQRLLQARARLIDRLNEACGPLDESLADTLVTNLVGAVDGPVMVVMRALAILAGLGVRQEGLRSAVLSAVVRQASKVPTVPLILREATVELQVGDFQFAPGEAFAVDAGAVRMPFGFGVHACPRADLGLRFAETMVRTIHEAGFVADVESLVEARVRLHYGPARLVVRRRA